jgi:hypothetical protein
MDRLFGYVPLDVGVGEVETGVDSELEAWSEVVPPAEDVET